MAAVNTPPQYVFELTAVQAVRKFLSIDAAAEDIAEIYANALEPLYNTEHLADDIIRYIENALKFIASVDISDVDLLLESYQYYVCNYENLHTKRNKRPMFRSLLKGQEYDKLRVYKSSKSLMAYVYGMRANTSPLKPETWTVAEEEEFKPIFELILPNETPPAD
ncbi:MAG: hypothetical protein RLZ07_714 [Pseudomonadota bacterium]|jgi:hypothetical protein